ncbi:MAG: hypothetical protein V2B18_14190 [Pseudomonadota bacterium]
MKFRSTFPIIAVFLATVFLTVPFSACAQQQPVQLHPGKVVAGVNAQSVPQPPSAVAIEQEKLSQMEQQLAQAQRQIEMEKKQAALQNEQKMLELEQKMLDQNQRFQKSMIDQKLKIVTQQQQQLKVDGQPK